MRPSPLRAVGRSDRVGDSEPSASTPAATSRVVTRPMRRSRWASTPADCVRGWGGGESQGRVRALLGAALLPSKRPGSAGSQSSSAGSQRRQTGSGCQGKARQGEAAVAAPRPGDGARDDGQAALGGQRHHQAKHQQHQRQACAGSGSTRQGRVAGWRNSSVSTRPSPALWLAAAVHAHVPPRCSPGQLRS